MDAGWPSFVLSYWVRERGLYTMGEAIRRLTSAPARVIGLSDRGTWLSFKNRGGLTVAVEGDRRLFNPYGVILVNPERHPHVKRKAAMAFIDWLTSAPGQAARMA